PGRQSRTRLLDHVAELAFQLLDAPLELVEPRRELGRIEMGTADGIPGVDQSADLLLELLDDPASPRLEVPDGLLPSLLQLVPHLAHVGGDLGACLPCEGLRLATELPEEALTLPADAFDGVSHLRERASSLRACHTRSLLSHADGLRRPAWSLS